MSDIVPFVLIFRAVKLVHHARDEAANVKRPQRWVKWLGKSATSEHSQNCADIHLLWMLTLSFVISQQLNAYLLRYSIPGYYLRTRLVIFDLSKLPMFTQLLVSFEIFNFAISDNGKRDSFRAAMILGHATTIFETPLRSDSIALHRPMRSLLKQSGHF